MPESNVAVTATFEKQSSQSYSIEIPNTIENGTVTVSKSSATKGTFIHLTANPEEDYMLEKFIVTDEKGNTVTVSKFINTYYFVMPASAVTVSAEFTDCCILISDEIENGTLSVDKTYPSEGETVTITFKPDPDATLSSLTATKKDGTEIALTDKDTNSKTFTMPKSIVTITATFDCAYKVGDIIFKDGSKLAYTETLSLTDQQKADAIAVIFYKGTEVNPDNSDGTSNTTTFRILGAGLKDGITKTWELSSTYASNYGQAMDPPYNTGWTLPTLKEMLKIRQQKDIINDVRKLCNQSTFNSDFYWTSTQATQTADSYCVVEFNNNWPHYEDKDSTGSACVVYDFTTVTP